MRRGLFAGCAAFLVVAGGSAVGWLPPEASIASAESATCSPSVSAPSTSPSASPSESAAASPQSSPVSTETPVPSPSASPETAFFPGAALTWTAGDSSVFSNEDASTPLIPWRDGFVSAGSGDVWLADAFGTWTCVADPLFADSSIMWMAASDDVLLAFGPKEPALTDNQEWLSSDGASWSSVPLPDVFSDAQISSVDYGPAGFLVSGVTENDPRAVTALSPDGRNWTLGRSWTGGRAARGPFGPLDPAESISTSVSSLGYLAWLPLHQQPTWLSADGLHWQPLTGTNAEDIETIQSASDGYLATIGQTRHCRIWQCGGDGGITWPTYRQSVDGKTWTDLPLQHLPPRPAIQPGLLLSDGQTFLVIDFHGRTWSSSDGLDWQANQVYVSDPTSLTATDSLHFGSATMALGDSRLASLEWDGQSTTVPWFAAFSAAPAASALPFPMR